MMKLTKLFFLLLTFPIIFSCNDDDNEDEETTITYRDEAEVYAEDIVEIEQYLETHFYRLVDNPSNTNYQIVEFDTIAGENANKPAIMDSDSLRTKTVVQGDIDYILYYLEIREGAEDEYQPTFADKVIVAYRGELLDGTLFDENVNPVNLDLPGTEGIGFIPGFTEAITEFRGASTYTENGDGTISYSDPGMGAIFIPSGLGYFGAPPAGIPTYAPLVFSFQLYKGIQADHDGDGIPSSMEDTDGDKILYEQDEDYDNDGYANYMDADDDGDGTPTAEEIEVNDANEDGIITEDEIIFTDSNNDGTPDYLDPEIY